MGIIRKPARIKLSIKQQRLLATAPTYAIHVARLKVICKELGIDIKTVKLDLITGILTCE